MKLLGVMGIVCIFASMLTMAQDEPVPVAPGPAVPVTVAPVTTPWPAKVPDFVAPAAGEHPRLLFRKTDIPALRKRAETADGKAIIAQLKALLGGGDAMPTKYSTEKPVNSVDETAVGKQTIGTFTLSHGAGFGMLYVLTGEQKYADFSRECVEKIFEGQVDRDSRYNWATPGTGFRMGFVLQSICMAYDLSYDGWTPEYRKSVMDRVMACKQPKVDNARKIFTLESLASGDGYPPGSNHFGPYLLGPTLVALTFTGEPGADEKRLEKLLATTEKGLKSLFGGGYGDHGWYTEGTSCGRITSNNGVSPMIQSLKIAAGKDYISPRPDARYAALRIMFEIVPTGDSIGEKAGKKFPVASIPLIPHRGVYGDNNMYARKIISHLGDFPVGMGAVLPDEAKAMAWIYNHSVETGTEKTWNTGLYPHLAISAFVNWPETEVDPDEVLPHVVVDDISGYYIARNRWQDKDDILVTTDMKRGPGGYYSGKVPTGTMIWGLGEKFNFGTLTGKTSYYRGGKDGSMELADAKGNALVVDYSNASGAPALIAILGETKAPIVGKKIQVTVLTVNDIKVSVLTLKDGEQPKAEVADKTIKVGDQIINVEAGKLTLTKFTEMPK